VNLVANLCSPFRTQLGSFTWPAVSGIIFYHCWCFRHTLTHSRSSVCIPKHENALYSKGNALDALGNHIEAIEYYDKALAINPKDETALYNKGVVLDLPLDVQPVKLELQ
jgi:tetratricopeptide (TPR) repeat protein